MLAAKGLARLPGPCDPCRSGSSPESASKSPHNAELVLQVRVRAVERCQRPGVSVLQAKVSGEVSEVLAEFEVEISEREANHESAAAGG